MIRLSLKRDAVTVTLTGSFSDVTVTLKRLTSADYGEAQQAAHALVRNDAELLNLLVNHDLLPDGGVKAWKTMKDKDVTRYAQFISGIAVWIGAVECGLRGITAWTGIVDDAKQPARVSRDALEVLMLDEDFSGQVMAHLDAAARILVIEGKA